MSEDVLIEKRDGVAMDHAEPAGQPERDGRQAHAHAGRLPAEGSTDREVRCVVLTGAGRAFCAGGDVKGMAAGRDAVLLGRAGQRRHRRRRRPWRGASRGCANRNAGRATCCTRCPSRRSRWSTAHAVGAGLSLALACDIRIASDKAKLGTIFRNVGFSGDFGGLVVPAEARRHRQGARAVLHGRDPGRRGAPPHRHGEPGVSSTTVSKRRRWRSRAARVRPDAGVRADEGEPQPRRDLRRC